MNAPSKCVFHFMRDPNLPLHVTHGVWGGFNQQGEIEMNFFSESEELPERYEQLVAPDGTLLHEETLGPDPEVRHFRRTIHSRILVTYETAKAFASWLNEHLELHDDSFPDDQDGFDTGCTPNEDPANQRRQ